MKLLSELKRRNVLRMAALYAVVAWLIMQVGEVTFEPLHFPDWAMTALIVVVIAGFPIAMALAWFFNFTLRGITKDIGPPSESAIAVAASQAEPMSSGPSIAVLSFDDMSLEKDQEYLCAPHRFDSKDKQSMSAKLVDSSRLPLCSRAAYVSRATNCVSLRN